MRLLPTLSRKTGFWVFLLLPLLLFRGYTQDAAGTVLEELIINAEDVVIEEAQDRKGFQLYIRKKPALSSVILTESTQDSGSRYISYSYRLLEWNEINGDETRIIPSFSGSPSDPAPQESEGLYLMDSTPESHPLLGEAFHIYIPPEVGYGYPETRYGRVAMRDGQSINIRAFALPYIDYAGPFKDNPFILSISRSISGGADQDVALIPLLNTESDPESDPSASGAQELPSSPDENVPPDSADAGQGVVVSPEPASGPLPESAPKEEVPAATLDAWGGAAVFLPNAEGRGLDLRNSYAPVGALTLTGWFTGTWGGRVGFDRDPLLMNRIFARFIWDRGFIGFEAGPYFGFLNSGTGQVSPGLSLVLHLRLLRWNIFSSFQYDTALGKEPVASGDYIQSLSEIKAGITLPFGGFTLSMTDRSFTMRKEMDLEIIDHWIRYKLTVEITRPLKPWGIRVDMGYQQLQRTYHIAALAQESYPYYDVYGGLGASCEIGAITLFLGFEAPLYPFVYPEIQSLETPQAPFCGQISLGIKWTLPSF
ncbi:MAG: hypothetical protein LBP76_14400 [Treponema sp.]|nr:hypothetical protein [Treponema sp.]